MNNPKMRMDKLGQEIVQEKMSEFIENFHPEQVSDDKTVVVLTNASIRTKRQPKEYYYEPDWAELKRQREEAWRREAYPGLFKDSEPATEAPIGNASDANFMPQNITSQPINSFATKSMKSRIPKTSNILLFSIVLLVLISVGFLGVWGVVRLTSGQSENVYAENGMKTEGYPDSDYGNESATTQNLSNGDMPIEVTTPAAIEATTPAAVGITTPSALDGE
jgi:hypothetical protein